MSSVGRNSVIMASGTAASRITGQIRTILLAAALGTTGLAANAYQAGSMIPQLIYTLVSGGIFNAVLVPQIVRTLEKKNAEERLNKLITFAILLLLALTVLMSIATPVLTMLYAGGSAEMQTLTCSFTLWCMPQIFFYGIYTVLGQVLAAKEHFAMYAWSSVAANIISCLGFGVFIIIFGKANRMPLSFWNGNTLLLTAGFWTIGVAAQALVLFLPLIKCGIHYKPSFGIRDIGLRSMGPVAAWSMGIVIVTQIVVMITTHITTSVPFVAEKRLGLDQFEVAGNATYQNAYTMFLLPYSLVAVSVATAIFPKISRSIASHDLHSARNDLSEALRHVSIIMCFFTVIFIVIPTPISLALIPSISVQEANLMSAPLMMLAFGLPLTSSYLIIQRTFFAFEDGKSPFIFAAAQLFTELFAFIGCINVLPPTYWVTALGSSVSISYFLTFPSLVHMLRNRFNNDLDDRNLIITHIKIIIASIVSIIIGFLVSKPLLHVLNFNSPHMHGALRWVYAILICAITTIIIAVVYLSALLLLRTRELVDLSAPIISKLAQKIPALVPLAKIFEETAKSQSQHEQKNLRIPRRIQSDAKYHDSSNSKNF
ncbi:murein biosynthesis integral membrane protein MurJ [Gardnerella vaginalis]|uniref:murein biosynthesis integral membrane protein MurJ n=1 Tax=Gardnerella leopoldii TaxID=2792978 RepID=UPI000E34B2B1|nr:murein biosynthesis integral membrane protein MurJ [Gardnerella vaginalis]NSX45022.1 murein biosynthesis integral membrane protein MurJ [Gardnerella vaginalis]RFT32278.1 lipid II flippase MurJ [Bifidobacteriaceae bacterium VN003]